MRLDHSRFYSLRARLSLIAILLALLLTTPGARAESSPTHTIQPGETLSQIAQQYDITLDELMVLNSITDPDEIYFGQILVLPTPPTDAPAPDVEVDATYSDDAIPIEHVVQPGESLSRIAEDNGLSLAELMTINGITDPDTLVIGTRLRLTPVIDTGEAQLAAPTPDAIRSGNPIATLNRTYTVDTGDSVPIIAVRFGVDEDALRWLNGLDDSTLLALGQVLILPATSQELVVPHQIVEADTENATTDSTPTDDRPRYTVQPGDSLSHIAQDNGLSLAAIMEANQIANPDAIYVGQELVIPPAVRMGAVGAQALNSDPATETVAAESNTPVDTTPRPIGRPRSGFFYYTVKLGDNLSELAREFDSTQLAILEYNNLPNTDTVYAGLELRIPYGPPPLSLNAPPIPFSGSHFVVSLSRQQCWLLAANHVRFTWHCSTGYGAWITRTGSFAVQSKIEMAKSTAYELDMPYWLGIYDVGTYENGIHGLPIRWDTGQKIWEGLIGQPATFGCAMLDDEDASTLFDLAFLGMPVHIVP